MRESTEKDDDGVDLVVNQHTVVVDTTVGHSAEKSIDSVAML